MKYQVNVSVNISETPNEDGYRSSSSMLSYYKTFFLEGDSFSSLAPAIDRVVTAATSAEEIARGEDVPTPTDQGQDSGN